MLPTVVAAIVVDTTVVAAIAWATRATTTRKENKGNIVT